MVSNTIIMKILREYHGNINSKYHSEYVNCEYHSDLSSSYYKTLSSQSSRNRERYLWQIRWYSTLWTSGSKCE